MSASKIVGDNAYHAALAAGLGHDEAKRREAAARAQVRAQDALDDPVGATLRYQHRKLSSLHGEAARLRRERDALLSTLADALNIPESEAWLIARLDLEDDDAR